MRSHVVKIIIEKVTSKHKAVNGLASLKHLICWGCQGKSWASLHEILLTSEIRMLGSCRDKLRNCKITSAFFLLM